GLLGSLSSVLSFTPAMVWVVWVGVVFMAAHVLVSVVTSYEQLTDVEFPPSARKKRHLLLKWVTGGLLLATVVAHITCVQLFGAFALQTTVSAVVVTLAVVLTLAIHICVGAKSLLTDLGLDKRHMTLLRWVVVALAVAIALITIASLLM
ncbi:MAG: hypothetical protein J5818_00960, partial [Eggerthellaceae bacterium]|nr:hypothetical protein [Eggerthellaceae bacterium]